MNRKVASCPLLSLDLAMFTDSCFEFVLAEIGRARRSNMSAVKTKLGIIAQLVKQLDGCRTTFNCHEQAELISN